MEQWQDQGIILSVRRHGENGAIVSLLTQEQGRRCGYLRGAFSTKYRGSLEIGSLVDANWRSRVSGSLGSLTIELSRNSAASFMQDALKLAALQSACALCDQALPEAESHPGLFKGLSVLLEILKTDIWGPAYVMWEIALLKELGFSLDLTKCAGGGRDDTLAYVSPKTGRAVSYEAGEAYRHKLLSLPGFLKPHGGSVEGEDVLLGLIMTGYFLEHWAFAHHSHGIPEARQRLHLRFHERFAKTVDQSESDYPLADKRNALR